jgi:OOP family OmpA-OmpF porin
MKNKLFLVVVFLMSSSLALAQFNRNNISVELNYGYNGAIKPYKKQFKSNFSGFNHFEVGIRYMFSEHLGAKIIFKSDKFVNDPGGVIGIQYNSLGAGLVYNVGKK